MDCFALLEEPRRPWIDVETLKRRFLTRSAEAHPDRYHQSGEDEKAEAGRRYADLNRAHEILSSHRARLRHLIELERGVAPADIQQTPPDLMDLFFECGALCQSVDKFLEQLDAADSPLLKARLFAEGLDWSDKVENLSALIGGRVGKAEVELKTLDARWESDRAGTLPALEALYRNLSYFERWRGQLQARFVRLAT